MPDRTATFVELWTRAQPEVRRYVFMLVPRVADAEDVLQQTATQLWGKFDEYDPSQPFVPWAIKFAYYEVLSWRQRQARQRLVFSDKIVAQINDTISAESSLLEVRRRVLDRCLQKLTAKERALLLQRYSEHGAVQREAENAGVSPHKLYYLIDKLRGQLLKCIDTTMLQEGWQHG